MASGQQTSTDSGSRPTRLAPQFYLSADKEPLATTLVLNANEARSGVDFALRQVSLTTVIGSLVPPEGIVISNETLILLTGIDDTPPILEFARLRADGTFSVDVHPGRYRVDVRAVRAGDRSATGDLYFSSTALDVDDVRSMNRAIPLRRGHSVSGRVRAVDRQVGGLRVRFLPRSGSRPAIQPIEGAISTEGRFSIESVAPGRYALELAGNPAPWDLVSVHVNGKLEAEVSVETDLSEAQLELVIASTTASLSGHIIGLGDVMSSYLLVLLSADDALRLQGSSPNVYFARADNTGHYLFSRCLAGSYVLIMLKDMNLKDVQDVTIWESLRKSSGAVAVTLKANTETRLDVRSANLAAENLRSKRTCQPTSRPSVHPCCCAM
jgi:hypothetical protein